MSYKVKQMRYEDLDEDQRQDLSDNGCGERFADYLVIEIDGENVGVYSNAMEPEDVCFSRDLSWIKVELEAAYKRGFHEGRQEGYDEGHQDGYDEGVAYTVDGDPCDVD